MPKRALAQRRLSLILQIPRPDRCEIAETMQTLALCNSRVVGLRSLHAKLLPLHLKKVRKNLQEAARALAAEELRVMLRRIRIKFNLAKVKN